MAILNYSTKVSPEKTIGEIQKRLVINGARKINFDYDNDGNMVALMFQIEMGCAPVFFSITPNVQGVLSAMKRDTKIPKHYCNNEQAWRVAWRIEKDWLESQLAKIEAGLATPLQILLPYAVSSDGQTFYQKVLDGTQKLLSQ